VTNDSATPCAGCGRSNLPTTRFCAQCGEVVRADPPRRSRKRRRRSRKRIHWVRVPNGPPPSIVARSSAVQALDSTPERSMRRPSVALAAIVAAIVVGGYAGYVVLGDSSVVRWAAVAAVSAPAAQPPMPALELPRTRAEPTPAPALMPLPGSRAVDVVPPRAPKPAPGSRPDRASQLPLAGDVAAFGEDFGAFPAAPVQRAAASPPPAVAPRKDALQLLDETIADCTRRSFLGRIACEQRALLQYCDGQWGSNTRCPSGRTADYGN
jgi:hypothetical protein